MPAGPGVALPTVVEFARSKYGRPLLVDAGYVASYPHFDRGGVPHSLAFYDILLVTRGHGSFALDDETHEVSPALVLFSRPGDVRRWQVANVDGACVFFTEDFIAETFSDPRFLDQFAYFRAERPSGAIRLQPGERRQYLNRFDVMRQEIAVLRDDASHAMRAVLYELLVWLNRLYVERHGLPGRATPNAVVERFLDSVERNYRTIHRVAAFAAEIGVSTGHLNALCRAHLRRSAGAWIRGRIALEARRLLLYTDLTSAEIAYRLGFDDPSYFTRFFRRESGVSPLAFRGCRWPR